MLGFCFCQRRTRASREVTERLMGILGFNLNFYDQLSFYGAYHHNKWNQLVHFVFVPAIFWSASVWLAYTGQLIPYDLPERLVSLPSNVARYVAPTSPCSLIPSASADY